MGTYTRAALQTTVMGWAAPCDEQMDRHRATMAESDIA